MLNAATIARNSDDRLPGCCDDTVGFDAQPFLCFPVNRLVYQHGNHCADDPIEPLKLCSDKNSKFNMKAIKYRERYRKCNKYLYDRMKNLIYIENSVYRHC